MSRSYGALTGGGLSSGMLHHFGRLAVTEVRAQILREKWKKNPFSLMQSVTYSVRGAIVYINISDKADYHNSGVRPHQMFYLMKATKPVPIKVGANILIFRIPSKDSFLRGKWQHPGIEAKHFVQKGIRAAQTKFIRHITNRVKNNPFDPSKW